MLLLLQIIWWTIWFVFFFCVGALTNHFYHSFRGPSRGGDDES